MSYPSGMAQANANRKALRRHFDQSPNCRRCGSVTSFDVAVTHPLRATLEHLYKSGDPRREETKGLPVAARTTLFCYRCNITDGQRYGEICGSVRALVQAEAKALAALISGELLFGGYVDETNVAQVKAMLQTRFVSKEYLARIKKTVNESDRIEQETIRITKLLNAHREWLHAQPGVLILSVGVRPPAQICLCVGGSVSPKLQQSIREKIGDDVYFETVPEGAGASKGRPLGNGAVND
jgi:hypothetical protein